MNTQINRRAFLQETAGLTFALALAADPQSLIASAQAADGPLAPNLWLTIATDGTITIVSPAAEMGQGTFTTLPLIIAEELDADWAKVKPSSRRCGTTRDTAIPAITSMFQTTASASVHGYFMPLRIAGAQARRVLHRCGRRRNGACRSASLSTEPSVVVHKASGRRIGYGEIAAFAKAPAELPKIEDKDLKPTASFRLIGKDVPRVEVPLKVTGRREIRHGRAGARHGLRGGAAIALSTAARR